MRYTAFLEAVHATLSPERYLEIGVRRGKSLALARCRAVGIDPNFEITAEIDGDVALIRTTSDEYFSRENPLAPTGGLPFDLAFIDGLHLFEFALRDFINTERHCTSRAVIVFDDMLPRSIDEAARERHTAEWTGDVYRVIEVLAAYRPDLSVIPVDTTPTGVLLVVGLDPKSTVLSDNYDEIMARFRTADPQPVPMALLDRLTAVDPGRVLAAEFWDVLRSDTDDERMRADLAAALRASLGEAFGPAALSAR